MMKKRLFIYININKEINLQSGHHLSLAVDFDNNASTGLIINGIELSWFMILVIEWDNFTCLVKPLLSIITTLDLCLHLQSPAIPLS